MREEAPDDHAVIGEITAAAFRDVPYASGNEAEVVERLRAAGALLLSLVAVADGTVVGHVAFSAAEPEEPHWSALGPVSVLPSWQRRGVGSALINAGLDRLARGGAAGCMLVGDPDYYSRFGFRLAPDHLPSGEPPDSFMLRCFGNARPAARLRFHSAFYEPSP